jgi:hypothetical protein
MAERRGGGQRGEATGSDAVTSNPEVMHLADFLASCKYTDGSSREGGSVTLFFEGGRFKVAFNEKTDRMVGFGCVSDLACLADELESLLSQAKLDWRPAKPRR